MVLSTFTPVDVMSGMSGGSGMSGDTQSSSMGFSVERDERGV